MKRVLASTVFVFLTICVNAQQSEETSKPVFKRGYSRLGFSRLGTSLNENISPEANVVAGSYGASTGYVLEFGHIFYFRKRNQGFKFNVGLDWTMQVLAITN